MVDAAKVTVAPGGTVYAAPEGTTEPTNESTALNAAFLDLGYVSEDGVRFRQAPNVTDIGAWQSEFPIRSLSETREGGVAMTLREWSTRTFKAAFGGGSVSTLSSGHYKYSPPTGTPTVNAIIVHWQDGAYTYRIVVPRAQNVEAVEVPLRRAAAADLAVSFRALAPAAAGDPWYLLTDDPAFAS